MIFSNHMIYKMNIFLIMEYRWIRIYIKKGKQKKQTFRTYKTENMFKELIQQELKYATYYASLNIENIL